MDPMGEVRKFLLTGGGKIRAPRCQALSKRTGDQCGAPAEKGRKAAASRVGVALVSRRSRANKK
jgi:hypothetical protein